MSFLWLIAWTCTAGLALPTAGSAWMLALALCLTIDVMATVR